MKKLICLLMAMTMLTCAACAEGIGNELGFRVLRELYDGSENRVISPLSLAGAMAMAAEGAVGDTRSEILAALGAESVADVAEMLSQVNEAGIRSANAAFLPSDMVPKAEYVAALEEKFGAEWFSQAESKPKDVNRWVKKATDGMIPEIAGEFSDEVQMVLINAVAMDAKWQFEFDPNADAEGVFHAPQGDRNVTYMNQAFYADYGERENVQLLRMGYRDCGLSLLIALPSDGNAEAVLDGLCEEGIDYFRFREKASKVRLSMPKTDLSVTQPMTDSLRALGVEIAFSDAADFSGIADQTLKIGSVLQKTRLILDEAGTRAAAATMISMDAAAIMQPEEVVEFRMDRPFVFVIADEAGGTVCFAGIVTNPVGN